MSKTDLSNCNQHLRNLQQSLDLKVSPLSNTIFSCNDHQRATIRQIQQRLMTYKELKLHEDLIDQNEIQQLLVLMTPVEKDIALHCLDCVEFAVKRMDEWLKTEKA